MGHMSNYEKTTSGMLIVFLWQGFQDDYQTYCGITGSNDTS